MTWSVHRTWLATAVVLLVGAWASFAWEFNAADAENRPGGLTWREPVLVLASAVCFAVGRLQRRRERRSGHA